MASDDSEKTEEPTGRRRQKEREKGNVSKSQDMSAALMVTLGVALLAIFSKSIMKNLQSMLHYTFTNIKPSDISSNDIMSVLNPYIEAATHILMPFFVFLTIFGILIMRFQTGAIFAPSKIKFDLNNISPSKMMNSAKKMLNPFEPNNMVEFAKSLLKLIIVFACGYSAISSRFDDLVSLLGQNIITSFTIVGSVISQMVINMCLAMLIIGLLDKKYQDYNYHKSIKMTKQEVKDEYKDTEGDPQIKAKLRSMQMQMMRNKMLANVASADVVVTNPTHYAIALRYNRLKDAAPVVVAKGVDFIAFKIREIAQANKVPIVENPPLARTLYKLVPIDGIIPSDMFVAVAEVLAYVYNQNKRS